MIFYSKLGDYVRTDVDDQLDEDDFDDYTDYYEERSKGNIIRIDHVFMVWLNGIVFAWNFIHEKEKLSNDEVVPDWDKVVDDSRRIGDSGNFFAERCRLDYDIKFFEFLKNKINKSDS